MSFQSGTFRLHFCSARRPLWILIVFMRKLLNFSAFLKLIHRPAWSSLLNTQSEILRAVKSIQKDNETWFKIIYTCTKWSDFERDEPFRKQSKADKINNEKCFHKVPHKNMFWRANSWYNFSLKALSSSELFKGNFSIEFDSETNFFSVSFSPHCASCLFYTSNVWDSSSLAVYAVLSFDSLMFQQF